MGKKTSRAEKTGNALLALILTAGILLIASNAFADGETAEKPAPEGPPMPLHAVEGVGGSFAVHSAYLVNPPKKGEVFGLPSVGGMLVHLGQGRQLESFSITETLWGRLELGYAWNHFDAGDLHEDVLAATGVRLRDHSVDMHNFNARLLLLEEGQSDLSWVPAVTVGFHYKRNVTIDGLDNDLGGLLSAVGVRDNDGEEYTLTATKKITLQEILPKPLIVSATVRNTDAVQIGWFGFSNERTFLFEGSVAYFLMDNLYFCNFNRFIPI